VLVSNEVRYSTPQCLLVCRGISLGHLWLLLVQYVQFVSSWLAVVPIIVDAAVAPQKQVQAKVVGNDWCCA